MVILNSSSCYELFGFDVLLDSKLKPWLMEVNISPSLKFSCNMDFEVKSNLVVDLFNLVGIKVKDMDACRKSKKRYRNSLMLMMPFHSILKIYSFMCTEKKK
jgi:hypothetical protein